MPRDMLASAETYTLAEPIFAIAVAVPEKDPSAPPKVEGTKPRGGPGGGA